MPSSKPLHSPSRDLRNTDEETALLGAQKPKTFNQLSRAQSLGSDLATADAQCVETWYVGARGLRLQHGL